METISSMVPGTQYMQYNGRRIEVLNITDQLCKVEGPVDMDQMTARPADPEECKKSWMTYFSGNSMRTSPIIGEDYQEIESGMEQAVDRFLDGNMTEDELKETFQSLLGRLTKACDEKGYPPPLGADQYGDQARADCFFREFRLKILDRAMERNYQEGLQYAANGGDGHWQYYNSDYYYKTEAAVSAVTEGVTEYCREKGYGDFTPVPIGEEYKLKVTSSHLRDYTDFNSAWEYSFGVRAHQTFLDGETPPPKDFVWFYEFGGKGDIYAYENKAPNSAGFQPDDPRSARMWISYRDTDGTIHKIGTNFVFDGSENDLRSVFDLLSPPDADRTLTRFLQNLRVFSGGYFQKYPLTGVDIRA